MREELQSQSIFLLDLTQHNCLCLNVVIFIKGRAMAQVNAAIF